MGFQSAPCGGGRIFQQPAQRCGVRSERFKGEEGASVKRERERMRRLNVRWAVWGLLLLWSVLGWVGVASAQAQAPTGPVDGQVKLALPLNDGGERLGFILSNRQRALEADEAERAERLLDAAITQYAEYGMRRYDALGHLLLDEAAQAHKQGQEAIYQARIKAAQRVAPGLPAIHDLQAQIALKDLKLHVYFLESMRTLSAHWRDFSGRLRLMSYASAVFLFATSLGALLFLLVAIFRYGLHAFQDLTGSTPGLYLGSVPLALLLSIGLSLYLGLGLLLWVVPLLFFLWPYQNLHERIWSGALLLALAVSPWMLRSVEHLSQTSERLEESLYRLELNPLDREAYGVALGAAEAGDWLAQASVSFADKRTGALDGALTWLQKAQAQAPDDRAVAYLAHQRGNLLLAQGEDAQALVAYQQALPVLKNEPALHFNMHRLYRQLGQLSEAAAALERANELAPKRVSDWSARRDPHINTFIEDVPLPRSYLNARQFAQLSTAGPWSERAWVWLAGPVSMWSAPILVGLSLLLLVPITLFGQRFNLSWPCERCGRRVETSVSGGLPAYTHCTLCEMIYMRGVGKVQQETRFVHDQRVSRWGRVHRILELVSRAVPGLSDLAGGRPWQAAVWLLPLIGLLGLSLRPAYWSLGIDLRLPGSTHILTWSALILLWSLGVLMSWWQRRPAR